MRRPHEDHLGCSGGFLFKLAGRCRAFFSGNSTAQQAAEPGFVARSGASVTFSRFYEETQNPVRVCQFDRLYLPDNAVLAETWELFEHSPTGIDKLKFPVAMVIDSIVARDGSEYSEGDFVIRDGKLEWGMRQPPSTPDGRGLVCSVRYRYRPYWMIQHVGHDLRLVTQDLTTAEGDANRVVAVYQAAQLVRESFFETEDRDPQAPNPESPRQRRPPSETPRFGPR